MKSDTAEVTETHPPSLDERVSALERELENLRRTTNRRNWAIEALLLMILLMGATAWIVFRG